MRMKNGIYFFSYELFLFGLSSVFFDLAAKNIHIDRSAKIIPEDNEVINESAFPSTNISTGDSHLIRCDIESNPNTNPDVMRAVFCIDIFKFYFRGSLGVVIQHIIEIPKIPKYKGLKSFLIARKRMIIIIIKIIFLRKGCLMDIPFIIF